MILTALSILARLGALAASVIVVGLGAKFISNLTFNTSLLVYIEVVAATSVLGALIPPYPNFLYELVWGLAWLLAAIFALVVQFLESDCYGFRPDGDVNCATYKAGTAFTFLAAFAWLGSAFFGGLRILAVIFNLDTSSRRPLYVGAEREPTEKPEGDDLKPKKKKVKGPGNSHIARYFVCYGIFGVVLVAVGLPILLIYAAPAFGQYLLEKAPIPDVNITLSNPTNDSISFTVRSGIRVPDTLKATFTPMHIDFFLEDTRPDIIPIAFVDLPQLTFESNQLVTLENQTLTLGNLTEFARLIDHVAHQPTFRVAGQTRTKVSAGPVNTWVDLYKAVELNGFNNFPQLDVKEFGVQSPDDEGHNVYGKVIVQNPSPASVTLGDVTLAVLVGNTTLGEALVEVKDIVPGNNVFNVKAKLHTKEIEQDITKILEKEIPYLKKKLIMATATGISVVYQGTHLPYWEKAFRSIKVTATRPVRPLLQSVVESGVQILGGNSGTSAFLGNFVSGILGMILKTVKNIPEEDVESYAKELGKLGKLALRLLSLIGIL